MKLAFVLLVPAFLLLGCVAPSGTANPAASATPALGDATASPAPTYDAAPAPSVVSNNDSLPSITAASSPPHPGPGQAFVLSVRAEDDFGVQSISWQSEDAFSIQPESNLVFCGLEKSCSASFGFVSSEGGLKTVTVYATDSSGRESSRVPIRLAVGPFDASSPTPAPLPVCGNRVCDEGESSATCSGDCAAAGPVCGNNACDNGEGFEVCPADCPYAGFACANGKCEGGESYESCPQDCGVTAKIGTACGDGACQPGEDAGYCPRDCADIKPNCGNMVCDSWETESTCREDCLGVGADAKTCSTNAACGYKEACKDGKCTKVDCTNDGQCGYAKKCKSNRCVRCRSGPYGPAC